MRTPRRSGDFFNTGIFSGSNISIRYFLKKSLKAQNLQNIGREGGCCQGNSAANTGFIYFTTFQVNNSSFPFHVCRREFPLVEDWHGLQCRLNNRGNNSLVYDEANEVATTTTTTASDLYNVSSVRPSEFLCSYETHCFALCMCCDFFACDCRMKCSDGCHCYHDQVSKK